MNKILLVAIIMTLAACGNSQQEQKPVESGVSNVSTSEMPKQNTGSQAVKPAENPNVINIKDGKVVGKNRTYRSKARPKDQIEQVYPYDISLKTAEGKEIPSNKVLAKNGKPTVLMFWLTTCTPCRFEMKAIKEKFPQWQEEADFNFYAISTDFERNYEAFVKMVNENGWEWETYNDVNREFRSVMPGELNGLPQTFVLDKDGQIVYHKRKWKPGDEDVMFSKVKGLSKG